MIAGGKIKESVEIYEEGSNEQLSRTIRDFKNFANTYDLFTEVSEAFINEKFHRTVKRDTKDIWDELITGEIPSETNFDIHLADLVTNELGTEAFKY